MSWCAAFSQRPPARPFSTLLGPGGKLRNRCNGQVQAWDAASARECHWTVYPATAAIGDDRSQCRPPMHPRKLNGPSSAPTLQLSAFALRSAYGTALSGNHTRQNTEKQFGASAPASASERTGVEGHFAFSSFERKPPEGRAVPQRSDGVNRQEAEIEPRQYQRGNDVDVIGCGLCHQPQCLGPQVGGCAMGP